MIKQQAAAQFSVACCSFQFTIAALSQIKTHHLVR